MAETKLTPDVQEVIVKAVEAGEWVEDACALVGINKSTYYRWLKKGEKGEEPYRDFCNAIRAAEALDKREAINRIRHHAVEDWRADVARLERRYPSQWGRRDRHDVKHEGGIKLEMTVHDPNEDEG